MSLFPNRINFTYNEVVFKKKKGVEGKIMFKTICSKQTSISFLHPGHFLRTYLWHFLWTTVVQATRKNILNFVVCTKFLLKKNNIILLHIILYDKT